LVIALNFTDRPIRVPGVGPGRLLLSTELDGDGPIETAELRADEGILVEVDRPQPP
jgi:hypothetical protein